MSLVIGNDHHAIMLSRIRDLFQTGAGYDLEIRCGLKRFRVHKVILGFYTNFFQNSDCLWQNVSLNPVVFEKVLEYIYLGQIVVEYNEMEEFFKTCKDLGIKLFDSKVALDPPEPENFQGKYNSNDFELICRKRFKTLSSEKVMKKHTYACQKEANFECEECHKVFRFKVSWQAHMAFHRDERNFKCDQCPAAFHTKSALTCHWKNIHGRGTHEFCNEYACRVLIELHWRADLLNAPFRHDHDPVGEAHGFDLIMGHKHERSVQPLV